jgi:hypothetical protein
MSLLKRFESFLAAQPGAESIDALAATINAGDVKRADFFLDKRSIILEIKALANDPSEKPQVFVEKLCKERDIWVYGRTSTTELFSKQSDGPSLEYELYSRVTRGCQDAVADAQHQIAGTRQLFNVPDALGILVLINESAPTVDIELMANRVARTLRRQEGADLKYPAIEGALLLSEHHALANEHIPKLIPMVSMLGCGPDERKRLMSTAGEGLMRAWAIHNGLPMFNAAAPDKDWPLKRT